LCFLDDHRDERDVHVNMLLAGGIAAARNALLAKQGWDVAADGTTNQNSGLLCH
jgi:hypothetical protein